MKKNASLLMPCLLAAALVLAGCATRTPAPVVGSDGQPVVLPTPAAKDTYTVKSGDTLYSIARDNGIGYRDLIALNRIENPNQITEGQVLRIRPQVAAEAATTERKVVLGAMRRPSLGSPQHRISWSSVSAHA